MSGATIRPVADASELEAAIAIRRAVFVDEQGVSEAEEIDGRDGEALHLVAVEPDGEIVGTCRLLADGEKAKLGRVAVLRQARRRGIALALLQVGERHARDLGAARIVLGAQIYALGLYEQAGYRAYGDVFLDAGLEHVWMDKQL